MKTKILNVVYCMCLVFTMNGQQIDFSAIPLDTKEDYVSARAEIRNLKFTNLDSALALMNLVVAKVLDSDFDTLANKLILDKVSLLTRMGKYQESQAVNDQFLPVFNSIFPEYYSSYCYFTAVNFSYQNQLDSAVYYYKLRKKHRVTPTPFADLDIAITYSDLGDTPTALKYYEKCLALNREQKDPMNYLYLLSRVMDRYKGIGLFEKYAELQEEYLQYKKERGSGDFDIFSIAQHNTAKMPFSDIQKEKAEAEKMLNIYEKNNHVWNFLATSHKLAKIYRDEGKYGKAYRTVQRALQKSRTTGDLNIALNLEQLASQTAKLQGNYKTGLEHLSRAFSLKDSIRQATIVRNAAELEEKYESANKENQIALLTTQDELNSLKLAEASRRQWVFLGTMVVLLGILGMLAFLLRKIQQKNRLLAQQNELVIKTLNEKDTLLREIHHRVKNNLQVVSSLLNLQSNYIEDDTALEAITEGKNRVSSMALIHQNLYQEQDLTSIDAQSYFENLVENLFDSYNIDENNIQLTFDVQHMKIDVETMIPLGLISNELISNALKHAFTDQANGHIHFSVFEKESSLVLQIADNGKGMNAEDFFNQDSFGNKLINAFKNKLGADIEITNEEGTTVSLYITKYKLAA